MEPKRFHINQDGIEYAMAIKLLGERVKVEAVDSSAPGMPIYSQTFTLEELCQLANYFTIIPRSNEAQLELIAIAEAQQIRFFNNGDILQVAFFLPNGEDLLLDLPKESLKVGLYQSAYVPGKSLYQQVLERPGFGTPFVDPYGDRGFFDTGLAASVSRGVPVGASLAGSALTPGLAASGLGGSVRRSLDEFK